MYLSHFGKENLLMMRILCQKNPIQKHKKTGPNSTVAAIDCFTHLLRQFKLKQWIKLIIGYH